MKITSGNALSTAMSAGDNERHSAVNNTSDVSWFSSALQMPAKTSDTEGNQSWINKMTRLTGMANSHASQAERALAKSARSIDSKSLMDTNRTLSTYYLESLLNAKLVGKGVQSLEKLTNLQ